MQVTELLISSFPEGNLIIQKTLTFQVITENKTGSFSYEKSRKFPVMPKNKIKKKILKGK